MDLHEYFCERKKSDRNFKEIHFAKALGVDKTYLSQIKIGNRVPSMKLAKKIEELSKGNVNALELIEKNYQIMKEKNAFELAAKS